MNSTTVSLTRLPLRALWLALAALLLTANCGGGSGGEATPIPPVQTTPTSTRMLPIVTPTLSSTGSPASSSGGSARPPAADSPPGHRAIPKSGD